MRVIKLSNEEILFELKKELIRIGSTNRKQYDLCKEKGSLSSSQVTRRLEDTWKNIVKKIGLKPEKELQEPDVLLKALKVEFERLGSYKKEFYKVNRNKDFFPHPRVLIEHLNMSWAEITKECGCNDNLEKKVDNVSDNELIKEYKKLSSSKGNPLSIQELSDRTVYSYEIYRQHFGTIGELRKRAGFNVKTKRAVPVITKEDCIKELLMIYDNHGQVSFKNLKQLSRISLTTIFRKFHTTKINKVWEEVLNKNNIK